MNSTERRIEFLFHRAKRQRQRRPPSDQHIIVAVAHFTAGREPDNFPQPAPHPVALDGIADLARYRETDADAGFVAAPTRLQRECAGRRPRAMGSGAKVGPACQPLHGWFWNGCVWSKTPITH